MSDGIPDGIEQLRTLLRRMFTGLLPEAQGRGTPQERENNFLSRALAAYAVHELAECSPEQAAAAVVDGGGDGGIDAIYYARQTTGTLWIVQSKFIARGAGQPDGLGSFRDGLEALLDGNLAYFENNERWRELMPEIERLMNDSQPLQIRAVFVYSSIQPINTFNLQPFDRLCQRYSADDEYFRYSSYNLSSIMDWMTSADQSLGVPEVRLTLHYPGRLTQPYEIIYGAVRLSDVMVLYQEHGARMIAANIRGYQGDTEVNLGIFTTLQDEPDKFLYLNNGLTAYCERLEITHSDRDRREYKRVTARGFSVINGAQTLGSIQRLQATTPGLAPDGYVFVKLISLERCENDIEFAQRITRTANFQNRINVQHFIAQQSYQQELARQLLLSDVHYHYREDVDTPVSDEYNFSLKEATTALACLDQNNDCDFVARILVNYKSLLSLEEDYPDAAINKTRYSRVFRSDRDARTVWRAVQAQSIVIEQMKFNGRAETGTRKTFFESARWLILNIVFLSLRSEQGNQLTLTPAETQQHVDATIQIAEVLWGTCLGLGYISQRAEGGYDVPRSLRSVFSNAVDCARLRGAVLARLNGQING